MITVKMEIAALITVMINDTMGGKYLMGAECVCLCMPVPACTVNYLLGKLKPHPVMHIANTHPTMTVLLLAVHGIK